MIDMSSPRPFNADPAPDQPAPDTRPVVAVVDADDRDDAAIGIARAAVAAGDPATVLVVINPATIRNFREFADAEDLGPLEAEGIAAERLAMTFAERAGVALGDVVLTDEKALQRWLGQAHADVASLVTLPQTFAGDAKWGRAVSASALPVQFVPRVAAAVA